MAYMSDYKDDQLLEREFFFGVLCTLYPRDVHELVQAAYKTRQLHYTKATDESIEMTADVKAQIDKILSYKSKISFV